jgi:hypothetical protein
VRFPSLPGRARVALFAAVAALVVVLPRTLDLAADPPPDVANHFLWDEGLWLHNARLRVLFGRWVMDDQRAAMNAAPLYSAALAGVYRVLGTGFVPTRLLAGLSGALACGLLYLGLRARHPARTAAAAALLLGTSYFTLTHNRIGLPESFQLLLVVASAMAVYLAAERPRWALAGGVLFVAAQLAKPSALLMAPVFAGFWLVHRARGRGAGGAAPAAPPWNPRVPWLWATGVGLAGLAVVVTLVIPNWDAVREQALLNLGNVFGRSQGISKGLVTFFGFPWVAFGLNGFWRQSLVPLAAVLLLLVARLARVERRPASLLEAFAWCWLSIGLVFLAAQRYQPDRRFLLLMPAVAMLGAVILEHGGVPLPARTERPALWRRALAGALAGGFIGLYQLGRLGWYVRRIASILVEQPPDWLVSPTAVWSGTVVAGAALAGLAWRWLPARSWRVPAAAFLVLFAIREPGRWLLGAVHPTYTMREAARGVAALTRDWDRRDRVGVGGMMDTFGQESDLFTFPIRQNSAGRWLNADGWERFRPGLVVAAARGEGASPGPESEEPLRRGYVLVDRYPIWPGRDGRPTWTLLVFVRGDLARSDGGGGGRGGGAGRGARGAGAAPTYAGGDGPSRHACGSRHPGGVRATEHHFVMPAEAGIQAMCGPRSTAGVDSCLRRNDGWPPPRGPASSTRPSPR